MDSRRLLVMLFFCAAALRPGPARAGESPVEARLRDALRTATAQLRAAEDEKARLQASEAALQKKVAALEAQLAAAAKPRGSPRAEAELRALLAETTEEAAKLKEGLARCETSAREAGEAGRAREQEQAQLVAQVGPLTHRLTTCEAKNAILHRTAREILDRYAHIGLGHVLGASEPFVGAKRVEIENLVQEYEDKLLEHEVTR